MTEHLRAAAARRHNDTEKRATDALRTMSREGVAVTFAAVARRAGVSIDFLYRHPTMRTRILELRTGWRGVTVPRNHPRTGRPSSRARAAQSEPLPAS